jgi:hypothetical protein
MNRRPENTCQEAKVPWYQRVITWGLVVLSGCYLLGGGLDAISNALALVTPKIT